MALDYGLKEALELDALKSSLKFGDMYFSIGGILCSE